MTSTKASRSSVSLPSVDQHSPIETAEVVRMMPSASRPVQLLHRQAGSNASSASTTTVVESRPTTPPTPALSATTTSTKKGQSQRSSGDNDFDLPKPDPCYLAELKQPQAGRIYSKVGDSSSASLSEPIFDASEAFNIPPRKPLKVNPFKLTFNLVLAFGLIAALITGYAMALSVFDLGITSIGLYGIIVLGEYIFQVFSALWNRYDVNRIANQLKKSTSQVQTAGECEKGDQSTNGVMNPGAEISIGIVGYREDDEAWRQCLRTLQKQNLVPKCIIGVVDGNEQPDLDMANAFISEFEDYRPEGPRAPLIHLPILLSDLHFNTYMANIPEDNRSRVKKYWDWLTGHHRPGHEMAVAIARQAVIAQVQEWDRKWNVRSLNAVCFSQPHGHKRTALFTAFAFNM